MSLFSKKSVTSLLAESHDQEGLKKTLSSGALVALGIGAIIGAGLFSITGMAAANHAGPAIMLSFVIAAMGCAFAGLCYAEFASMIPVAGSAYTYSYATMGEFIAWIIGWDLVLEYAVGAATVASSWSGYLGRLLSNYGLAFPEKLMITPFDVTSTGEAGLFNLPAVFIVVIISLLLIRGTSESAKVNNVIVFLKVGIVLAFIVAGFKFIRPENLTPFIPENTGTFGEFGWQGVIRAAAIVFFAYIGFDAVSTAAQETKNPSKSMPIGILGSLIICTVLYVLFAYVMLGVAHYTEFKGASSADHLAPVAIAIDHMGYVGADGKIVAAYPWLNTSIIIAILLGYASVIMVMLLGQSRVFYSMSKDGLIPPLFSQLHKVFKTPAKSNLVFMLLVSLFAAFVPGRVVGEMTSIGTLFAFILVCLGVIVMRRINPDVPRSFKTPLVPLIPILGIICCLGMMVFLPLDTWIRLIAWMIVGLDIYLFYGISHSHIGLREEVGTHRKSYRVTAVTGFSLTVLLAVLGFFHGLAVGHTDGIAMFAYIMVFIHALLYFYFYIKGESRMRKAGK